MFHWRETIDNYLTSKVIENDDFLISYWYWMYKINSFTSRVLRKHIERVQNKPLSDYRTIDF